MAQKLTGLKNSLVNIMYIGVALIIAAGMTTAFQPLVV